ncbi:MAG: transglutaminase family protein [Thermoplasmata archaeon]
MLYKAEDVTTFTYSSKVVKSSNVLHKMPVSASNQKLIKYTLRTDPEGFKTNYKDRFGNPTVKFDVLEPHKKLEIVAESIIDRSYPKFILDMSKDYPGLDINNSQAILDILDKLSCRYPQKYAPWLGEYLERSKLVAINSVTRNIAKALVRESGRNTFSVVRKIMAWTNDLIGYEKGQTSIETTSNEVLRIRFGVCQDYAHIMIAICRSAGIPARYVQGYLVGEGETHAWVEVYYPGIGWVEYDPTYNIIVGINHIKVACGRDYSDTAPITGKFIGKGSSTMNNHVKVVKLD